MVDGERESAALGCSSVMIRSSTAAVTDLVGEGKHSIVPFSNFDTAAAFSASGFDSTIAKGFLNGFICGDVGKL